MRGKKVVHARSTPERDEWETPDALFAAYNRDYNFTLDAAATAKNTKCKKYFTKKDNALEQTWKGRVWCNPPYSQWQKFVEKAHNEFNAIGCVDSIVMLLPARTDTKAFHDYIWDTDNDCPYDDVRVQFIRGRVTFKGAQHGAPFPSMVVIWS